MLQGGHPVGAVGRRCSPSTLYCCLPRCQCCFFCIDWPLSVIRWALCTRRSRRASAMVGSPITLCQCSTGSWLVMMVDAVPCRSSITSRRYRRSASSRHHELPGPAPSQSVRCAFLCCGCVLACLLLTFRRKHTQRSVST